MELTEEIGTKTCNGCHESLPLPSFPTRFRRGRIEPFSLCRPCATLKRRERRERTLTPKQRARRARLDQVREKQALVQPGISKFCIKCDVIRPVDEFHRNESTRDGLVAWCKTCMKAYSKVWQKVLPPKKREEHRQACAAWRAENREKGNASARRYYHANKDKCRAQNSDWLKNNREKRWNARLLIEYGISLDEYKVLLEKCDGVCSICRNPQREKSAMRLVVDHDHATGEIRGLLCSRCNRGLGMLGDTAEALARALSYLQPAAIGAVEPVDP